MLGMVREELGINIEYSFLCVDYFISSKLSATSSISQTSTKPVKKMERKKKPEGKTTHPMVPVKPILAVVSGESKSEKLKKLAQQKYVAAIDALNLYEKDEEDLHTTIEKDGQWRKPLPFGDKKVLVAMIMSTPILHDIFYPPSRTLPSSPFSFLSNSKPSSSLQNLRETTSTSSMVLGKSKAKSNKSNKSGKPTRPSLASRMTWSCGNCSFVNKMNSGECASCRRPNVVPRTSIPPLELASLIPSISAASSSFPPLTSTITAK